MTYKLRTEETSKRCGTCARGQYHRGNSAAIACGAPVNEDAILGLAGVNAIWAERKYNRDRIVGLAAAIARAQKGLPPDQEADTKLAIVPEGSDADWMHPNDGVTCKMWKPHADLADEDRTWYDITAIGSPYEEQIAEDGKRRHRPLRLGINPREFGEERGIGDWRPGPGETP